MPSSGGGPSITVRGQTTVNSSTGGGAYAIDWTTPFQKLYLTAAGKTGYIQIDLPSAVTAQGISLVFATLPASFTLQFQAATSGGAVGAIASLPITAVASKVGTLVASARPSSSLMFNGKVCTIPPVDPALRLHIRDANGHRGACDPAFYAPSAGTMSFTITGTDSDGHAINFRSQTFTLLAGQ